MASSSRASSPPACASYNFVAHKLAVLLGAFSRPFLADRLLPLVSGDRSIW